MGSAELSSKSESTKVDEEEGEREKRESYREERVRGVEGRREVSWGEENPRS